MKCMKCGAEVPEGASFCTECGTAVTPAAPVENSVNTDTSAYNVQTSYTQQTYTQQPYTSQPYYNTYEQPQEGTPMMAIVGLVLGIASIVLGCFAIGLLVGIPGIILSVKGNKERRTGIGTAGLICSIIGTSLGALSLVYYIYWLALFGTAMFSISDLNDLMNDMEYYNYY